jgi:hypothetical protein
VHFLADESDFFNKRENYYYFLIFWKVECERKFLKRKMLRKCNIIPSSWREGYGFSRGGSSGGALLASAPMLPVWLGLRVHVELRLVLDAGLLSALSALVQLVVLEVVLRITHSREAVAGEWRLVWMGQQGRWELLVLLVLPTKPRKLGVAGRYAPCGKSSRLNGRRVLLTASVHAR